MIVKPYPLQWPLGHPRTPDHLRVRSRFGPVKRGGGTCKGRWTFAATRDDLLAELERLRASNVVLSTNVRVRSDGLPYSNAAEPTDPGVAIYFQRGAQPIAMACDHYDRVADNIRALVHTIESLRRIERHGSARMMEQAFSGFAQLPAARPTEGARHWREVFCIPDEGRPPFEDLALVCMRWRAAIKEAHTDRGGSDKRAAEINRAYEEAKAELRR